MIKVNYFLHLTSSLVARMRLRKKTNSSFQFEKKTKKSKLKKERSSLVTRLPSKKMETKLTTPTLAPHTAAHG